ncbi:MAG: universal stress protein [Hyphomonadaceae bacterium]|nr:universal stress protein [Hyphomonadaceae bacterium]
MGAWREILVFADGSEDGLARMRMAWDLAQKHDARLEALVLRPPADLNVVTEGAVEALRAIPGDQGQRVHVHRIDTGEDDAQAIAAREARLSDIVIFGKPETLDNSPLDTEIFAGALLGGGRPCLMLPRWISPRAFGRRPLVAWRGDEEAARALHWSLPFLREAEEVRICLANPRSEREGEDEAGMARLASYVRRHGVNVGEPIIRESWEDSQRMILSELEGFNADMLVMGAFGTPRLVQELFGGVTTALVREARVPVLLAH